MVKGCRAGSSGASAMRNPPAARRACAAATSPARPDAPASSPPCRRTPGRPGGRGAWPPSRPSAAGWTAGAAGGPLAGQPVLVEPVTHRGRMHPKLAGDAGAWPSPSHRPVGQVGLQRREAELGGAKGELLVGAAAARVGGGHLAGCRGDACGVQQAAGDGCGVGKLAASCAGLACCWQRACRWLARSLYPCARAWSWRRRCWGSRTVKPPLRVSLRGEGAGGGVMRLVCRAARRESSSYST